MHVKQIQERHFLKIKKKQRQKSSRIWMLDKMLTLLDLGPGKTKSCNIHIYHFHVLESPHLDFSNFWGCGGELLIKPSCVFSQPRASNVDACPPPGGPGPVPDLSGLPGHSWRSSIALHGARPGSGPEMWRREGAILPVPWWLNFMGVEWDFTLMAEDPPPWSVWQAFHLHKICWGAPLPNPCVIFLALDLLILRKWRSWKFSTCI